MGMTGAYERNLDAKGRLSLPAPLREELGEHVRVFKALDVDALYVFSAEAFDKWVEGLFAGREGHEGFNPRDINDQKLMRAINKRTTSMDVDKGLLRQLPSPEPQKKEQQQSVVDKANLMALRLTAGDTLLVNGKPMQVSQLKEETIRFVHRLGKKHLISIESDRDADYNLYFQMQNQLMEAYSQLRNETAQKKYHRDYALLNNDQKEQVRNICPQRITESYANAMTHADQRVDVNAEEKQGEENSTETATEQQKGGKQ